jgi:hypothetical protein
VYIHASFFNRGPKFGGNKHTTDAFTRFSDSCYKRSKHREYANFLAALNKGPTKQNVNDVSLYNSLGLG